MKYILGANYWGRKWGTEMWRHYDGAQIRDELKQLADFGVKCLRVFPNWRDFQPVDIERGWRGAEKEYVNANTREPICGDGVDMEMIDKFRDFCHAASENGLTLVVSIVTGWMSGKLFYPPVLSGKNLMTDPESLKWMRRFIHRFVKELKNEHAIVMWGLGNECNCLGEVANNHEAYEWTATVVDAIRSEDNTRPISSDMHGLTSKESSRKSEWLLEEQGELCDVVTTHPYPSPTVGGNVEPYNRLRMTYLPTAQSLYYAGVSKKSAYIQESGTFSDAIGSKYMSADFARINILSSLANGLIGYQWWCAWEQEHLDFPPYSWSMIERQLGLFYGDGSPKPVAYQMQKLSPLVDIFPEGLPQRTVDGICVLSNENDHQNSAIASLILGKQAGLDIDVAISTVDDIPQSNLYFMPSITGWSVLNKRTWDTLANRVKDGATLCISYNGGHLVDFEKIVGAQSNGVMANVSHSFMLDGEKVDYNGNEIILESTSAQVLLKNESGNPVILKNKYGKGYVYFINFCPELLAFGMSDGFNTKPFYKLYKMVAKDIIADHVITSENSNICITHNKVNENEYYASVLNYSDVDLAFDVKVKEGWSISEVVYGSLDSLPHCDGTIVKLNKI